MGRRRRGGQVRVLTFALLALAMLVGACSADDSADSDSWEGAASDEASGDFGGEGLDAADSDDAGGGDVAPLPAELRDTDGRFVIRQGYFTVEYTSSFDDAFGRVATIAESLGGVVAGISSETVEGRTVGEVTVRVPVDAYDRLLLDVAEVGEVVSRQVSEEDVSGEVVDLRSRLRHLERQEAFYLGLFDEAQGVSDAIMIQQNLEQIQQRREQVQGRLDYLEQRTSTSTLRVRLVPEGYSDDGWYPEVAGFGSYLRDAGQAFLRVTGGLIVFFAGAAPIALLLGVAGTVAYGLLRRRRVVPTSTEAEAG